MSLFLPLGFGYLEAATTRPESCFWIMLGLIMWSFAWLHRVATQLAAHNRPPQPVAGSGRSSGVA